MMYVPVWGQIKHYMLKRIITPCWNILKLDSERQKKEQWSKITGLMILTIFKIHIQNWHTNLIRHCLCAMLEAMTYFHTRARWLRYKQLVPKGSIFNQRCIYRSMFTFVKKNKKKQIQPILFNFFLNPVYKQDNLASATVIHYFVSPTYSKKIHF